jgi:glycine oxidase
VIGPGELDGLIWATGHWRNGVLLAPLTADAVSGLLAGEPLPEGLDGLSPARFEGPAAGLPADFRVGRGTGEHR